MPRSPSRASSSAARERASRAAALRRLGRRRARCPAPRLLLAACGGVEGTNDKSSRQHRHAHGHHPKTALGALDISNWPLYIDKKVDQGLRQAVRRQGQVHRGHQRQRGVLRQGPPAARRATDIGRDIVVLTDWMAARWVRLGYVEPIDKANIPNSKNLRRASHPQWDPGRKYSLPWQSGMTAIGYNKKRTGRKIDELNDLFDPKFKGRVSLLSDARDSRGPHPAHARQEPEDATIDEVPGGDREDRQGQPQGPDPPVHRQRLHKDLTNGQPLGLPRLLRRPRAAKADNPDLEFVIPEEGAMLWSDNMLIPQKAAHPYAAETCMNYVYDPEVAAQDRGVRRLRHAGGGRQGGPRKTDPKLAEEPADLPARRDAGPAARLREPQRRTRSGR